MNVVLNTLIYVVPVGICLARIIKHHDDFLKNEDKNSLNKYLMTRNGVIPLRK